MIDPGLAIVARRLTLIATQRERGDPKYHAQAALTRLPHLTILAPVGAMPQACISQT